MAEEKVGKHRHFVIEITRTETPRLTRWWRSFHNSGAIQEREGCSSYFRYDGRCWSFRITWGAAFKLDKPQVYRQWTINEWWKVTKRVQEQRTRGAAKPAVRRAVGDEDN